jgi:mRNA interferase RelE/StbE
LAWRIEFEAAALKDLRGIDRSIAKRIVEFLETSVAILNDPRSIGEPLRGPKLGEFWKYRIGDYRAVVKIQDDRFTVVTVRIGHRREIYR